jgi:hypothetical protein
MGEAAGAAEYIDDLNIDDSDEVLRRIPPWHQPRPGDEWRPNSSAFYDDPDGSPMSAYLAKDMVEAGLELIVVMEDHPGYALVAIRVGLLRSLSQIIVRDPTDKEPFHVLVVGPKTQGTRRRIAKSCRWVVEPEFGRA